ncbi:MAG: hypothetical protein Q9M92_03605 [Enterobacterales bacterium]|nr:hypothetical protein [Enterobacterales bacterium]
MRTTLTIEDDVATRLIATKNQSHKSLKSIINELLRLGLNQLDAVKEPSATYVISPVKLGKKLPNLDNISEILMLDDKAL